MDYHTAISTIRNAASHKGRVITRQDAWTLAPAYKRAIANNNPLNGNIIEYRRIGRYVVELALSDWTGMRGGSFMCGITVWPMDGNGEPSDLSELVALDEVAAKLESLK